MKNIKMSYCKKCYFCKWFKLYFKPLDTLSIQLTICSMLFNVELHSFKHDIEENLGPTTMKIPSFWLESEIYVVDWIFSVINTNTWVKFQICLLYCCITSSVKPSLQHIRTKHKNLIVHFLDHPLNVCRVLWQGSA